MNPLGKVARRVRRPTGREWLAPTGRLRLVAWVMVALVGLGGIANLVVDRIFGLPADGVLRVGDVTVNQAQFSQRIQLMSALYGVQPPAPGPAYDAFKRDAAQAIAVSLVLERAAADQHVVVSDAQAQDALQKMVQSQFPTGQQGFDQALQQKGITEQNVLDELKRQLGTAQLYQTVTAGTPPVTEQDIDQAYQQRRAQLVIPERRHVKNIVVDSQEKAQQVLAQLRSGADINTVAATSSIDKSTSGTGGDLGSVTAAQLEKPVADAAFGLPGSGFYGPVQGQHGWNVGQVIEIQGAQPLSLDQARDALRTQLDGERHDARWRPWLGQQVAEAGVVYADAYRPANPDQLPPEDLK